jgi:hypothetical protein
VRHDIESRNRARIEVLDAINGPMTDGALFIRGRVISDGPSEGLDVKVTTTTELLIDRRIPPSRLGQIHRNVRDDVLPRFERFLQ